MNRGATLAQTADQITPCEVCRSLDDPTLKMRYMLGVSDCSEVRAGPTHVFIMAHQERTSGFMNSATIAD